MTDGSWTGESRHAACRHGYLNEQAWTVIGDAEEPVVLPMCSWKPVGAVPPPVWRSWGGLVDVERDCAVCGCWEGL
jgi:hypothetical protein